MSQPAPVIQQLWGRFRIVRDDLLEGGSKTRFLPYLIHGAKEVVFGGPFCGGAPHALSVLGRNQGFKVTLFFAARLHMHPRQIAAQMNGAKLVFVRPGYMTTVQKRARDYAQEAGALFLPLGFDLPEAEDPFVEVMEGVRKRVGSPDEVWCCAGSGMLTRCLSRAFPESEIMSVAVGLASRHEAQEFGNNVTLLKSRYEFHEETRLAAPFASCPNYDRKAWELCERQAQGNVLFWNVAA